MGTSNNEDRGVLAHEVVGPFNLPAETVGTSAPDQPSLRPSPGGSTAYNAILAEAARLEALRRTEGRNAGQPMQSPYRAKTLGCGCGPKSSAKPLPADMKAKIRAKLRELAGE